MRRIKFTDGCPNGCAFCYEPKVKPVFYRPDIPDDEDIQILDMNFLSNPDHIAILVSLPKRNYELVCGFDYRVLTQAVCDLCYKRGFKKIRWAWDYNFSQQKTHQKVLRMWLKAGYSVNDLSVFMVVNWKIPFVECVQKLDLLKVWNVRVNDCCFDGGYKIAKAQYWTPEQIKRFRSMCRKHNQLVRFKLDPEY